MKHSQPNSGNDILGAFAHEWSGCVKAQSVLHLAFSEFEVFNSGIDASAMQAKSLSAVSDESKFDLIWGDLPLGLSQISCVMDNTTIKAQQNWIEIAQSLAFLKHSGTALFLVEPLAFSNPKGVAFEKVLNGFGYFVNGIFNSPKDLLQPHTTITPVIIAMSKVATERFFVAELLDVEQVQYVVHNYFSEQDTGDLVFGTYIDKSEYHGFNRMKIRQQIERLETQYKTFENYRLGYLASEINMVQSGDSFYEHANAIYVPRIGTSPVVGNLEDAKLKHHNYFQVVFENTDTSQYLVAFFKSALGKMILSSMTSQTYIPRLNKQDLAEVEVALPNASEQQSIVSALHKLQKLKNAIQIFDAQLALNPTSSQTVLGQLDTMLDVIGSLSSADRVRGLVREGETKTIEFKETLSLDIRKSEKANYIEHSSLKTIVAFLNTEGGTLLIGVADDGSIPGLTTEVSRFYKNIDKFLLHLKSLIKNRIGESYYPFIDTKIVEVDGNPVAVIECKPSISACFLDDTEFYVRTNPATDKLDGKKLAEYLKNHFN